MKVDTRVPTPTASNPTSLARATTYASNLIRSVDRKTALLALALFGFVALAYKVISNWRLRQPDATDVERWMRPESAEVLSKTKAMQIPKGTAVFPKILVPLFSNPKLNWEIASTVKEEETEIGAYAWNLICESLRTTGLEEGKIIPWATRISKTLLPETWRDFWSFHRLPGSVLDYKQDIKIRINDNWIDIESSINIPKKETKFIITRKLHTSSPANSMFSSTLSYKFSSEITTKIPHEN